MQYRIRLALICSVRIFKAHNGPFQAVLIFPVPTVPLIYWSLLFPQQIQTPTPKPLELTLWEDPLLQ